MKLLIIGPYPVRNNGMSQYIEQYRTDWMRRGHEVCAETMYFWRQKLDNLRWLSLRSRLGEKFDAIIIQHTPTASGPLVLAFLAAARRAKVRTVVVGHEPPSIYAKHLPRFLRPLYHAYEKAVFQGASAAVVHTDLHARELRAIGVSKPIEVIPIPTYGPEPKTGSERMARPGSPTKPDAWGYYGMISRKKGLDLLLQAYQSRPAGHFPPLRILGGPAPGENAYVETIRAQVLPEYKSRIDFVGYVEEENLPGEFARLSLAIFPYRWVSQSAALAQTCFHRIPYLASDQPYFADFQKRHGCGRLFESGSAQSLAAAMDEAAKNPPRSQDLPFDALRESLSLSRCSDRYLEIISHAPVAA